MVEQELQGIEERANAATPGPWRVNTENLWMHGNPVGSFYAGVDANSNEHQWVSVITEVSAWDVGTAAVDAAFIAAARTDVPALVAEVRRLRMELAAARLAALAYRVLTETCPECTGTGAVGIGYYAPTGEGITITCPMCNGTGKRPTTDDAA